MKKKIAILLIMFVFTAMHVAAENGQIRINGFLSQGYLKSDENNYLNARTKDGTFEFNEIGLVVSNQLTDSLRFGMQFFAKDLGDIGNDDVTIDWALGDYQFRNWLGLRVGKLKRPTGLYNQSRDVDAARTAIFLPSSIYSENFREAVLSVKGLGIYGTLPGNIDYQVTHGVMDIPLEGSVVKRINDGSLAESFGTVAKTAVDDSPTVHFIWNTPLDGLRLGGTYYEFDFTISTAGLDPNPPVDIGIEGYRWIASAEYTWRDLVLSGEYIGGTDEVTLITFGTETPDTDKEGYYGMATYRLTDYLELGTYYSVWYPNKDNKDNNNYHKDTALTTRFDLNDFWILKIEGHHMKGVAEVDASTETIEDTWYLFAAKVTYSF